MPSFAPPELSDKEAVQRIVSQFGFPGADVNFANLFLYRNKYSIEILIENGILYRRYGRNLRESGYAFPIGNINGAGALFPQCKTGQGEESADSVSFRFLTEDQRNRLEMFYPEKYHFILDRDSSDYLYRRVRLASLEGREFHRKRNALFRFRSEYPDSHFVPLVLNNLGDALDVAEQWYDQRKENGILSKDLEEERTIMLDAFRWFSELDLTGGILYAEGKPAAMALASQTCSGVYDIHFEKTVPDKPLAFTVICSETARFLRSAVYINREEDMGISGLRTAKLSWFPEQILLRYTAVPKNPCCP